MNKLNLSMDVTKHIHIILNTQTFNFESMGPESSLALVFTMPHFTGNRPCSPDMLKEHLSAKPTRIPALDEMLRPLESAADEDCLGGALISQLSNH